MCNFLHRSLSLVCQRSVVLLCCSALPGFRRVLYRPVPLFCSCLFASLSITLIVYAVLLCWYLCIAVDLVVSVVSASPFYSAACIALRRPAVVILCIALRRSMLFARQRCCASLCIGLCRFIVCALLFCPAGLHCPALVVFCIDLSRSSGPVSSYLSASISIALIVYAALRCCYPCIAVCYAAFYRCASLCLALYCCIAHLLCYADLLCCSASLGSRCSLHRPVSFFSSHCSVSPCIAPLF
jgi:hypothetical protein